MKSPHPRKRFGQNFLHDSSVIFAILDAIGPRPHDHILEIGPGTGALTGPLLARCERLDVIELDWDLVALLNDRFFGETKLNIVCADALSIRLADFLRSDEKVRVVGNLPYNISTPLLFHLLEQHPLIQDMHFMLQKEVVDRICAQPGSKAFGKLSIMLQFHCKTEKLLDVAPQSFRPAPKVNSAVVRLTPAVSPRYAVENMEAFRALVGRAFSQRRKTLRNALKGYVSTEDFAAADIDPVARADHVDIAGYARLSNLYSNKAPAQDS